MNIPLSYLKSVQFNKYVLPTVGTFDTAEALVKCGIKPDKIHTADIDLGSCALGYLFTDKSLETLDIEFEDIPFDISRYEEPVEQCAELILALAYCQKPKKPYNNLAMRKELQINHNTYHPILTKQLSFRKKLMDGIHFTIENQRAEIIKYQDDDKSMIYWENQGYTNPKYKQNIYWDEPKMDTLTSDEVLNDFKLTDATIIVETDNEEIPTQWTKVFAELGRNVTKRTLINKNEDLRWISRKNIRDIDPKWTLYNDEHLTEDSSIRLVKLNREEADYYKDLFWRRTGFDKSDIAIGFLVDERLFGISGLKFGKRNIIQTYSLTIPSGKDLQKLLALVATSTQFENEVKDIEPSLVMEDLRGVKAHTFVHSLDDKPLDGVMKRVSKEQMPNQIFKLIYSSEFHDRSYKECMTNWVNGE